MAYFIRSLVLKYAHDYCVRYTQYFQHLLFRFKVKNLITALAFLFAAGLQAEEGMTLASTTSTEQSGFFSYALPKFETETGIKVRVVAVGTGQAMDIARRGDTDALLVHDRPSEEAFMKDGLGLFRKAVMHNDFVIVGPKQARQSFVQPDQAVSCMQRIAQIGGTFISRGDKSGTHSAELRLWKAASIDPKTISTEQDGIVEKKLNYKESGSGMGQTLNIASALNAFTLADRGTWAAFKNRKDLAIICQGDERLFNPYSVIVLNKKRFPHIKESLAIKLADWLTSWEGGQLEIERFRVNGEQVFFPDVKRNNK